jgi:hypothetical protein
MTATEGSIHSGFSQAGLDAIDRMMRDYVDTGKSAGMLTLVSRHGQIVQPSCYGQADIESQTPIREDTIFRIYSMTKPITSVALMTLMEQGHGLPAGQNPVRYHDSPAADPHRRIQLRLRTGQVPGRPALRQNLA